MSNRQQKMTVGHKGIGNQVCGSGNMPAISDVSSALKAIKMGLGQESKLWDSVTCATGFLGDKDLFVLAQGENSKTLSDTNMQEGKKLSKDNGMLVTGIAWQAPAATLTDKKTILADAIFKLYDFNKQKIIFEERLSAIPELVCNNTDRWGNGESGDKLILRNGCIFLNPQRSFKGLISFPVAIGGTAVSVKIWVYLLGHKFVGN